MKRIDRDSLKDFVLDDDIESVKRTVGDDANTVIQYARSPEMARTLVDAGADVYTYIGDGKIALDEMVKHFRINEFLYEGLEDMPDTVKKMLEEAQSAISEGTTSKTFKLNKIDIHTMRHMIFNGLLPDSPSIESLISIDHLFFRRYNEETMRFWTSATVEQILESITSVTYKSVHTLKEDAEKNTDSLGLILFFPELVYLGSRRPRTTMEMFRTVHSNTVTSAPNLADGYVPVTRYASGMSRGLFYAKESQKEFCGTFYYFEPESTTFLKYDKVLYAFDKQHAAEKLGIGHLDSPLNYMENDMMLTPKEWLDDWYKTQGFKKNVNKRSLQDRKYYAAHKESMYALQDHLDQPICEAARQQGYDVIFLENMIGSRQIVFEVLDVRSRTESFETI